MKGGAARKRLERPFARMATDRLEQWMSRRDPFERVLLGGIAIRAATRIAHRQFRQLPVGFALVTAQGHGRAPRHERVRQPADEVELQRRQGRGVPQEARDGLRHHPALAGAGASLDQHLQVQVLRRQPLQGVLADVAEAPLVDVPQQALFQVLHTESAGRLGKQMAGGVPGTQDGPEIDRKIWKWQAEKEPPVTGSASCDRLGQLVSR